MITDPLLLDPVFKETLWGGDALKRKLNKPLPQNTPIGESWEASGIDNNNSTISNGLFAGKKLSDVYLNNRSFFYRDSPKSISFPLLTKFIDAQDNLSVQVHPDDAQAKTKKLGPNGKTESWYIVEAPPEGKIITGFNRTVTKQEVRQAIDTRSLHELLNYIPIQAGDVLFVPAGTVHAILKGTLIYEVQQSCDVTLRMYDWGRTDSCGKSRMLHIEDSLEVLNTELQPDLKIKPLSMEVKSGVTHSYRSVCSFFALEQYSFHKNSSIDLEPKQSFRIITVLNQAAHLFFDGGDMIIDVGRTALVPACLKNLTLSGTNTTTVLHATVPDIKMEVIDPLRNRGVATESIALLGGSGKGNDLIKYL